jgi:hypothetical protein
VSFTERPGFVTCVRTRGHLVQKRLYLCYCSNVEDGRGYLYSYCLILLERRRYAFLKIHGMLNVMFIIWRVVYWILCACFDKIVWVSCGLFVRNPAVSPKIYTTRDSTVQRSGDSYRRVAGPWEISRVLLLPLRDRKRPWTLRIRAVP